MSQYSPFSNLGARGRSPDWYKGGQLLNSDEFDPSRFFGEDSATKSYSPPKSSVAAAAGGGGDFGSGLGTGFNGVGAGAGTATGTSTATATDDLGFSLGPGTETDGTGAAFGGTFSSSPPKSMLMSTAASPFGPGGLGLGQATSAGVGLGVGGGGLMSPYGYPPMPPLGGGGGHNGGPPIESWFDPSTGLSLPIPPAEQYRGMVDPSTVATAEAAADELVEAANAANAAEELTPTKPSVAASKRAKGTGGKRTPAAKAKTTVKKKKKAPAKHTRRHSAPAPISLKNAKSELGKKDVVMGRGGLANNNEGNKSFLKLTASLKPEYARLPKEEKTGFSRKLLARVKEGGGKFMAKDPASGLFYEVDDKRARRKCSQALREESKAERARRKAAAAAAAGASGEEEGAEDAEEDAEEEADGAI